MINESVHSSDDLDIRVVYGQQILGHCKVRIFQVRAQNTNNLLVSPDTNLYQ